MSHVNQVIGKSFVSWSQDMTTPGIFYKERLEIVAKAVAGLKDGSYEIISVGAAN